jgi:hypothetical protein
MPRDGGAAFPAAEFFDEKLVGMNPGMTLRDYFAAAALKGILASDRSPSDGTTPWVVSRMHGPLAERAYQIADAMLAERAK